MNNRRFLAYEVEILEQAFKHNSHPKKAEREYYSKVLDVNPRRIQVWFQNRRRKDRMAVRNDHLYLCGSLRRQALCNSLYKPAVDKDFQNEHFYSLFRGFRNRKFWS